MMRVALAVESLDPARGGAETCMHWLAGRQARDGHEVHVFAARPLPDPKRPPEGVRLHLLAPRGLTPARRAWNHLADAAAAIDPRRFDVVHAADRILAMDIYQPHGGTLAATMEANLEMLGGGFSRRLRRLRWRMSPRRRAMLAIEHRQFAREDVTFLAVSRLVRDDIRRRYRVPGERIAVIHNGVEVGRFTPAACAARRLEARRRFRIPREEVVVLLVAHNYRLKGLAPLVSSFALARRVSPRAAPDRLLVVGRGRSTPFLRLARRLGCARHLTFAGPVDEVLYAYAAADIYCQPTYYDPCSLTVLEALACGMPVITTRLNGAAELMTDGREGFILEHPAEEERLADRLVSLCEAGLRERMGAAARELAERHSTERNYRDILRLYRTVAARKRRSL